MAYKELDSGVLAPENLQAFIEAADLILEDQDWQRLGGQGIDHLLSTTPTKRKDILRESFYQWQKSPLIHRAINIKTLFCFSDLFSYKATDEQVQDVIDKFMADDDNQREITSLEAMQVKSDELQIFGELFFVLFTNEETGQTKLRTILPSEITDIITDPDDSKKPLWYKRERIRKVYSYTAETWEEEKETSYYRDWKHTDEDQTEPPLNKQAEGLLYHIKVNSLSDSKFGMPELYRAFDWNRSYVKFLSDLASIWAALSRFAWRKKIKGGPAAVAATIAEMKRDFSQPRGAGTPATASTQVENDSSTLEPMKTAGATVDADSGRRLLLQVCAASGIPEPLLTGDPSTSNLATTQALLGPALKAFDSRQKFWGSVFRSIFDFLIDKSMEAPSGILQGHEVPDALGNPTWEADDQEFDRTVEIMFVEMDDKDIAKLLDSAAKVADTGLVRDEHMSQYIYNLLGFDGVEQILEEMYGGDEPVHGQEGDDM